MLARGLFALVKQIASRGNVAARTGRMPQINAIAKAATKPTISRKEFLQSIGAGGREAKAQSAYLSVIDQIERGKAAGKILLGNNKSLVDTVDLLHKNVDKGALISKANAIAKRAKQIRKNPKKMKSGFKSFNAEDAQEIAIDEGVSVGKMYNMLMQGGYKSLGSQGKNDLARRIASDELYGNAKFVDNLMPIWMKKLGLSAKDVSKVNEWKQLARRGHHGELTDKLIDARMKYRKVTGMGHVESVSMAHAKRGGGRGIYDTARFPGKDLPKKEISDLKKTWNNSPLKKAIDNFKADFLEEYRK